MLEAVKHGYPFGDVSTELQTMRDVALAAVQHDGLALQYASAAMRNTLPVVVAAFKENGHALRFASSEMQRTVRHLKHRENFRGGVH